MAGYQVEYSSTPFLLFMIGELMSVFFMCALISVLFFGGWLSPIPGVPDGALWMFAKMLFWFFMFAMVKAIVPRYRYDQLMRIGWKVFLPLSLGWVALVGLFAQYGWFWGAYQRWMSEADDGDLAQARRLVLPAHGLRARVQGGDEVLLQAEGDDQLSAREGAA